MYLFFKCFMLPYIMLSYTREERYILIYTAFKLAAMASMPRAYEE